ncbi:hypothetical protein [Anaerotruncus rubiinfantis]|uniref:hypothetical protein n=1 Tax=Anaerotruncus rubiinfantis TaxID=1720200 RepID=UPI00082A5328|nr:hypothetical protein [Anaerotruncus rubiinfantis]
MKLEPLVKASKNIEALKKLGQIAKILVIASMVMLFGFLVYVGYSFVKTNTLGFNLEWGPVLFIFLIGLFVYGFLSFTFNHKLYPESQMILWAAGIGDMVFLFGAFNSYQVPIVFLGMLIFILALSAFIFKNVKKAINRIQTTE